MKAFDVDLKINVKPEEKWQHPTMKKLNSAQTMQNCMISDKSNLLKMKLAIDSEDDTSCSLITNPTLADQVFLGIMFKFSLKSK